MVAQDQGVLPEGKPTSHEKGHAAMPMCLRHVETTLVLVSGPGAGSSLSPVCGVAAISRGTSTAWRCWPCFEH